MLVSTDFYQIFQNDSCHHEILKTSFCFFYCTIYIENNIGFFLTDMQMTKDISLSIQPYMNKLNLEKGLFFKSNLTYFAFCLLSWHQQLDILRLWSDKKYSQLLHFIKAFNTQSSTESQIVRSAYRSWRYHKFYTRLNSRNPRI